MMHSETPATASVREWTAASYLFVVVGVVGITRMVSMVGMVGMVMARRGVLWCHGGGVQVVGGLLEGREHQHALLHLGNAEARDTEHLVGTHGARTWCSTWQGSSA